MPPPRAHLTSYHCSMFCRQLAQHQAEESRQENAVVEAFQRRRAARALQAWSAEAQHSRYRPMHLSVIGLHAAACTSPAIHPVH